MNCLVKAHARTSLNLRDPQVFNLPAISVEVQNWTGRDALGDVPLGLFFDVRLDAPDRETQGRSWSRGRTPRMGPATAG